MREGREVRDTGSSLGEASQGVDLTGRSILVPPEVDGVSRIGGGVLVKEVVGSEEEAHTIPHSHRVGDVLCMWDVQETGCHPGHQVLAGEKGEDHEAWLCSGHAASHSSLVCKDLSCQHTFPQKDHKSLNVFPTGPEVKA